jgi:hypothetical protein
VVVANPQIGYTELYGLNPQVDPIACAMLVIGCGTSLVGRLIQVMRGKGMRPPPLLRAVPAPCARC